MTRIAQCCCGSLHAEAEGDPDLVAVCHCTQCQRRTGSAFGAIAFFSAGQVRTAGASKVFTREGRMARKLHFHFCLDCGSTVFWEAEFRPGQMGIAVSAPSPIRTSRRRRFQPGNNRNIRGRRFVATSSTSRDSGRDFEFCWYRRGSERRHPWRPEVWWMAPWIWSKERLPATLSAVGHAPAHDPRPHDQAAHRHPVRVHRLAAAQAPVLDRHCARPRHRRRRDRAVRPAPVATSLASLDSQMSAIKDLQLEAGYPLVRSEHVVSSLRPRPRSTFSTPRCPVLGGGQACLNV